jgi:hypothetical protein
VTMVSMRVNPPRRRGEFPGVIVPFTWKLATVALPRLQVL